jgi:hypothetical protein
MRPHLKNLPCREKYRRNKVVLKPKGKNFKLTLSKPLGFYAVVEDTMLERFYLLEYTGTKVLMSRFTISSMKRPLWQTLYVIDYDDVRDTRTGQLYSSRDIITKYGG